MGQPAQSVALLLMEHVREPFTGPVLAYGKQAMNIGFEGTLRMFEALHLEPDPAGLLDPPPAAEYIDFERLVRMLGLGELQTLDVSAYEGAEIIADLNVPVPPELKDRFGWIIDGGTMEHVFDIRQGMRNTADMLRAGGRAVHITPSNNYVNHGFVQVSPALYHDYYVANGYEDPRGILIVQPRADILTTAWNLIEYDHAAMGGANSIFCTEETQMAVYFSARKTPASTSHRIPAYRGEPRADGSHYQFVITHGNAQPMLQPITADDVFGTVGAIHDVVHVGFGSGRALAHVDVL